MKGRLSGFAAFLFFVCVLIVVLPLTESIAVKTRNEEKQEAITSLPASLDGLYPPTAQGPVLLLAMHDLNAALTGIVVDISENDRAGAVANLERFEDQYRKNASLVPEWESWYPAEPLVELRKAVPSGAPEEVMAAAGKVGAVCHNCHVATMVAVQMKYHWPDFAAISVQDPVSGAEIDYPGFMQMLNAGLTGVAIDVGQQQPENARAQLVALRSRMVALKESCDSCHDTERAYFVDERIDALLEDMARTLDGTGPDPAAVALLTRRVGEESCFKCHLVHLPGAYSRFAPR